MYRLKIAESSSRHNLATQVNNSLKLFCSCMVPVLFFSVFYGKVFAWFIQSRYFVTLVKTVGLTQVAGSWLQSDRDVIPANTSRPSGPGHINAPPESP